MKGLFILLRIVITLTIGQVSRLLLLLIDNSLLSVIVKFEVCFGVTIRACKQLFFIFFRLHIDSVHPNIFSLINTLKEHQVLNMMNYIRLSHGLLKKAYRRPEDVKRDEVFFNLKTLYINKLRSLFILYRAAV